MDTACVFVIIALFNLCILTMWQPYVVKQFKSPLTPQTYQRNICAGIVLLIYGFGAMCMINNIRMSEQQQQCHMQ